MADVAALSGNTPVELAEQVRQYRRRPDSQPWYITALITGGGWVAAFFSALAIATFVMVFLNIADQHASGIGAVVAIIGLILNRLVRGEFFRAYTNAAILGGYLLSVVMLHDIGMPEDIQILLAYVVSLAGIAAILALTRDFSLHFLAVLICHLGLLLPELTNWDDNNLHYRLVAGTLALPVGLWLFTIMPERDLRGLAYGLVLVGISSTFPGELAGIVDLGQAQENIFQWGGKIGALLAMAWLYWRFQAVTPLQFLLGSALVSVSAALLLPAYGVAALAAMAFAVVIGHRTLALGATLMAIWSISRFYYDLSATLLLKSGLMLAAGLIMALVWYFFYWRRGEGT